MGRARQLADGGINDAILMDASAADTDVNDNILLNGTDSSSTDAGFNLLYEDGTHDASVALTPPTFTLDSLNVSGTSALRDTITLEGEIASGISLPATQVASTDANTLDDYEEGTFTPTISGSTSGTGTLSSANGRYTKIGRMVFCELSYTISNKGTISGTIVIGGFPFACGFFGYQGAVRNQGLGTDNTETVTFEMQKDTATGRFLFGSASSSNRLITDSDATNNDFQAIGITYST